MIACEEDSYVDYLQHPLVLGVAARNGVRHEGLQVLQPAPFSILTEDIAPNSRARAFSKYKRLEPRSCRNQASTGTGVDIPIDI